MTVAAWARAYFRKNPVQQSKDLDDEGRCRADIMSRKPLVLVLEVAVGPFFGQRSADLNSQTGKPTELQLGSRRSRNKVGSGSASATTLMENVHTKTVAGN